MENSISKILVLGFRFILIAALNVALSKITIISVGMHDFGFLANIAGFSAFAVLIYNTLGSSIQRALSVSFVKNKTNVLSGEEGGDGVQQTYSVSKKISARLYFIMALVFAVFIVCLPSSFFSIGFELNGRLKVVAYIQILSSISLCLITPQLSFLYFYEKTTAILVITVVDVMLRLSIALMVGFIEHSKIEWLVFLNFVGAAIFVKSVNVWLEYYAISLSSKQGVGRSSEKYWTSEILSVSTWGLIGGICGLILSNGINIIISRTSGTEMVGYRNIGQQIGNSIVQLQANMFTVVSQRINRYMAEGDLTRIFKILVHTSEFSAVGSTILILPLLDSIKFILGFIAPGLNLTAEGIVKIGVIIAIFEIQSFPIISIAIAHGRLKRYVLYVGSSVLLNLLFLAFFSYFNKSVENLFGMILILGVKTYFVRIASIKYIFRVSILEIIRKCVLQPAFIVAFIIMPYLIGEWLLINPTGLVIYKMFSCIASGFFYWNIRGQKIFKKFLFNIDESASRLQAVMRA